MAHDIYAVLTQPKPGQEDHYHQWYSDQHLPDLLNIPGIKSAQRYSLEQHFPSNNPCGLFLALYEFNDTPLAIEGILARRGTSLLRSSNTLNRNATKGIVFSSFPDSSDNHVEPSSMRLSAFTMIFCSVKAAGHPGFARSSKPPTPLSLLSEVPGTQLMHSGGAQVNAGTPPFQYALLMPDDMLSQAMVSFAEPSVAVDAEPGTPLIENFIFSARPI